jgi:integrase
MIVARARAEKAAQHSSMTVAEFVEKKFVPEYVSSKGNSGRMHYQSMLKHVLKPEEVDHVFRVDPRRHKLRLRSLAGWPYLGHVPLREVRPEYVQLLTAAALARGYSRQTVLHIRNVVSTIFSYAHSVMYFDGENPATPVRLPKVTRQQTPSFSAGEVGRLLGLMRYPEKEMTLLAILTGMTVAEICGLQWKRVNLTYSAIVNSDGETVPSKTILVREEWTRGQLGSVSKRRMGSLNIPRSLDPILLRLSRNPKFTGPNDFVLTSRSGSPVNQTNVLTRRLKPIGMELKISGLSWHTIRRMHKDLITEYGNRFQDQMIEVVRATFPKDFMENDRWRGNMETELPY